MSVATNANINPDSGSTCTTADPSISDLNVPGNIITIDMFGQLLCVLLIFINYTILTSLQKLWF